MVIVVAMVAVVVIVVVVVTVAVDSDSVWSCKFISLGNWGCRYLHVAVCRETLLVWTFHFQYERGSDFFRDVCLSLYRICAKDLSLVML